MVVAVGPRKEIVVFANPFLSIIFTRLFDIPSLFLSPLPPPSSILLSIVSVFLIHSTYLRSRMHKRRRGFM